MTQLWDQSMEWLEADGLGGFASGTALGPRTRRYHAVLLVATAPPTGRFVLVNGFDAWLETSVGAFALTAQRYTPDVLAPDLPKRRVESFRHEPWPRWEYSLSDGLSLVHELFVPKHTQAVALTWRLLTNRPNIRLCVRPLMSGRDYHSLHYANGNFRFDGEVSGERVRWRPYPGLPAIHAISNGQYKHQPNWYYRFQYDEERARGLDFVEDLAAPGVLEFDLSRGEAALIFASDAPVNNKLLAPTSAAMLMRGLRDAEETRRKAYESPVLRAADAYIARRGGGKTLIAGYPWFTDWGRDTFIAMRGLCLTTGRLDDARDILVEWSDTVSDGMLPNRFPDRGEDPEFNSIDASLWYVVVVGEWLSAMQAAGRAVNSGDSQRLQRAVNAILMGYARGTRYGIHVDDDGLLHGGLPGTQLTWMDAKSGDTTFTPRVGKPVEAQCLWLNALALGAERDPNWRRAYDKGVRSFQQRFWNEASGCLYDVVDPDDLRDTVDATFRPNQIFAVGGLPIPLLEGARARRMVDAVERTLWTPHGLRSLAPGAPGYVGRYEGGPAARDGAYHQGAAWPWLIGAFVEAWLRVRDGSAEAKQEARRRFVQPLMASLAEAGLGHVSELADAEPPHAWRGCPFQAWSLGELLRADALTRGGPTGTDGAADRKRPATAKK